MAKDFQASQEWAYMQAAIDRVVAAKMLEKLDLGPSDGDRLRIVCVEISAIESMKNILQRDMHAGIAAQARENKKHEGK